jgi:hypothetical protein
MEELVSTNFTEQRIKVLKTLGAIIKNLQETLPKVQIKNREMPLFYIDPQIVLNNLTNIKGEETTAQIPDRVTSEATVPIDYLEDVPVANGLPFWERIDCEPIAYYKLFKIYRDQKNEGGTHRSFENLKKRTGIPESAIHALSSVYHWQPRIRAYDLFKENTVELEKQKIIKSMENDHIGAAKKIFTKCMDYLEDISENGWYDLKGNLQVSPKDMIGWFEASIKLERLSLGLPADKPLNDEEKGKITKVITNVKFQQDNKTINLNPPAKELNNKYFQDMIDILNDANALPKNIVAIGDVQTELTKSEEEGLENEQDKV